MGAPVMVRALRAVVVVGSALALSACSMGSLFGGSSDASYADVSASAAQIAQAAPGVPAIATECPPIRVREGAGTYRIFTGNRTSDPSALRYQGVIEQYTRNCVVSNGLITVQMGASGRIITGPSVSEGSITVPLRFAVERDGVAVFSQQYSVPATLTPGGANVFSQTVENVQIPYTGGESITIWVGFDA